MGRYLDITGVKQGKLTVLEYIGYDAKRGRTMWMCLCECGLKLPISTHDLRGKRAHKSCRQCSKAAIKHNLSNTPEYAAWKNMQRRCRNEKDASFFRYGARGIDYDNSWEDFEVFYNDMGRRPSPKHTLERKNNDLGYSKENCCWETRKAQARNFRHNRILEHNGEKHCISEWAEILGTTHDSISKKLKKGYTVEQALTIKPKINYQPVEFNGELLSIKEIERRLGVSHGTIRHRVKSGISIQDAINIGIGNGGYKHSKYSV